MHLMPVIRHFFLNRFDDDGAGGCRRVAGRVGCDVVDGVRRGGGRVDDDVAHQCAIEEVFQAEILIDVVGHARAKVGITITNVNMRGVVAHDSDDGRRCVGRGGRAAVFDGEVGKTATHCLA